MQVMAEDIKNSEKSSIIDHCSFIKTQNMRLFEYTILGSMDIYLKNILKSILRNSVLADLL